MDSVYICSMTRLCHILLTLLMVVIGSSAVMAQKLLPELKRERPDLEKIRQETYDRTSPYYYPRLMKEFQRNDTLMKIDKFRRLYLGYMIQEDYNPYRPSAYATRLEGEYEKPNLTRQECDSVIKYAEMSLANNPFDLKQMMYLIAALRMKGKVNLANIWQYKLNYILMAIVSTGTGLDKDNAWYVIEPQHEYVLLNLMGYTVDNHQFADPYYEYITVRDPIGQDAGGFYFNIKTILQEYYRKYPESANDEDAAEDEEEIEDGEYSVDDGE